MNLSVGTVAFLVCLVLIMGTADSANLRKSPTFRDQSRQGANNPILVNKPSLERQLSSNVPTDPDQILNQVNQGSATINQALPMPLGMRIIQHVKELLQAFNINIQNLVNNLLLRIPLETRRNIAQGLGQIQSYIEMVLARANVNERFIEEKNNQPENTSDLPAAVEETSNEIVSEDEIDTPDATAAVNTAAMFDDENQDDEDEEVKTPPTPPQRTQQPQRTQPPQRTQQPPPPPPTQSTPQTTTTKAQQRKMVRAANRQNSQQGYNYN